jgi:isoquinoline 1-oxidoreductase alpha subunit
MSVKFSVNGFPAEFDGPEDVPLLWVVREHVGLTGSKFGCGIGLCGACTMQIDGVAQRTCVMPVMMAQGREVTTRACRPIPCRRPGSRSTCRNAAIASPA